MRRQDLTGRLTATWEAERLRGVSRLLALLAVPYGAAVRTRNAGYDRGVLRRHRVPARVVSVGNLQVGGTGKTPLTLWLATALAGAGHRPAIVARGYGKRRRGVVVVSAGSGPLVSATEGGDEAVMLARRFAGPIVTGEDRVAAARVAIERLGAQVVVLDDGFQHRRLARDVDIVVAPGRPAPPRLLPAGAYREPLAALGRAHALVVVGEGTGVPFFPGPTFRARPVARALVRVEGDGWHEEGLEALRDRDVVAAAAIARPERFAATLRRLGARVSDHEWRPDHHPWSAREVDGLTRRAAGRLVVTTEKDAVKWESPLPPTVRALRMGLEVDGGDRLAGLAAGTDVLSGTGPAGP